MLASIRSGFIGIALSWLLSWPALAACGDGASICWWIGTGNWLTAGNWSNTDGGASSGTTPAAGDNICFSGASNGNATINAASSPKTFDTGGCNGSNGSYTGTITHSSSVTITVTGNDAGAPGGAGPTYRVGSSTTYNSSAATSALSFNATSGTSTITQNGLTGTRVIGNVTIGGGGAGGSFVLGAAFVGRVDSTLTYTDGALDHGGFNTAFGVWTATSTQTRTWTLGNGTITVLGTIGAFNCGTTNASLTITANSSTIDFNSTGTVAGERIFTGCAKTWNNVSITNAAMTTNNFALRIAGSPTVANLTVTNARGLLFTNGTTTTVTGNLSYTGPTQTNAGAIMSQDKGSTATISLANNDTVDSVYITDITESGAGSLTANNSLSGGNLSGVTVNAPSGGGASGCVGC